MSSGVVGTLDNVVRPMLIGMRHFTANPDPLWRYRGLIAFG
ncbi:hypothetical protein ACNKHW_10535 [Shigella flexneri]